MAYYLGEIPLTGGNGNLNGSYADDSEVAMLFGMTVLDPNDPQASSLYAKDDEVEGIFFN